MTVTHVFFAQLLDETCGILTEKKVAIYARSANISFMGNKRLTHCTAEGVKDALCEFLKDKGFGQGG